MAELANLRWEYAVIEITNVLFDTINELGDERWELCMKVDNRLIFKRPKLDAFGNLAQKKPHKTLSMKTL